MRRIALISIVAALAAGCASNTTPVAPRNANSPYPASSFLKRATSSNLWEIQSSQVALQRSGNPTVRAFAQMIITEHQTLSQQIIQAAQSAGYPPTPQVMMPQEEQMLAQLRAAPSPAFDKTYREMQVAAHKQATNLFATYMIAGRDVILRFAAAEALPNLEQHLAAAQALPITRLVPPVQQLPQAPPPPLPVERG